jgi:hypothetical protein
MAGSTQEATAPPVEEEASPEPGDGNGGSGSGTAKLLGAAVAAMLLGGLGGAAQALRQRRDGEGDPEPGARAEDGADDEPADEHEADEPESRAEEDDDEDEQEAEDDVPEARADQDEDEHEPEARFEPEDDDDGAAADEAPGGISGGEAADIVTFARTQLAALLGAQPERVSGLHRGNGGWTVQLEVVEVPRIPPSTDVLATYELGLDGDRNLVSLTRTRRYRRSQIDEFA